MGQLIPFAWAKRKKQQEMRVTDIYTFDNLEVIVVENLRLKELSANLPEHDPFIRVLTKKRDLNPIQHLEILRRLQNVLPEFYGNAELINPYDPSGQGERRFLGYNINLPQGIAIIKTELCEDLGDILMNPGSLSLVGLGEFQRKKQNEIAYSVYGKSGILMRTEYEWHENNGDGLYVGQAKKTRDDGRHFSSSNEYSEAFTRVLNALCHEDKLTLSIILGKEREGTYYEHHDHSVHYTDGTFPLMVGLKDARIGKLKEANQQIGEFMTWMHEQRNALTELGEMVREIYSCYKEANATSQYPNADQIMTTRLHQTRALGVAETLYKQAERLFNSLTPPKNKRSEYLATPTIEKLL